MILFFELLVVVAVPALHIAKAKAKQIKCASNMRQAVLAVIMLHW